MKAQVIASRYVRRETIDGRERRVSYAQGAIIDAPKEEVDAGIARGTLREASRADAPLPAPNAVAAGLAAVPTTPAGTPIDEANVEGGFGGDAEWKAPRTHADADAELARLGVTAPADAKLPAKIEILEQMRAAAGAGAAPATTEDLSELSEEELIQRAIDFGHSEDEVAELGHDGLVLFVAEAMNRQAADPAGQAARVAELAARRDQE